MDVWALVLSLKTASVAIVITAFLGTAAAWGVVVLRRPKLAAVIDACLTLPLVLPPTVVGFLLLQGFGIYGPIGRFLLRTCAITIVFRWPATVLASVVVAFPLMYRSARGAFLQVDRDVIDAGRTLGLSPFRLWIRVVVPAAAPGLVSGVLLAFARGLGEFGATAMIAGNIEGQTRTLPLAVYAKTLAGDMVGAGYDVLVLVAIAFVVVLALNALTPTHRGLGRRS